MKLLIPPSTSYAISLMLTHFRYTLAPNQAESMMSIKNERELEGLRKAYIRDGVAFVRPPAVLCFNGPFTIYRSNFLLGLKANLMRDMISRNGKRRGGLKSFE